MKTTSVFIEILITGILALFLVVIIFYSALDLNTANLVISFLNSNFSGLNIIFILSFAYTLGVAINYFGNLFSRLLFDDSYKAGPLFDNDITNYEKVRAEVFQTGEKPIIEDLMYDRRVIRIARNCAILYFFISIFLVLLSRKLNNFNEIIISITIVFHYLSIVFIWYQDFRQFRYHKRIRFTYDAINTSSTLSEISVAMLKRKSEYFSFLAASLLLIIPYLLIVFCINSQLLIVLILSISFILSLIINKLKT